MTNGRQRMYSIYLYWYTVHKKPVEKKRTANPSSIVSTCYSASLCSWEELADTIVYWAVVEHGLAKFPSYRLKNTTAAQMPWKWYRATFCDKDDSEHLSELVPQFEGNIQLYADENVRSTDIFDRLRTISIYFPRLTKLVTYVPFPALWKKEPVTTTSDDDDDDDDDDDESNKWMKTREDNTQKKCARGSSCDVSHAFKENKRNLVYVLPPRLKHLTIFSDPSHTENFQSLTMTDTEEQTETQPHTALKNLECRFQNGPPIAKPMEWDGFFLCRSMFPNVETLRLSGCWRPIGNEPGWAVRFGRSFGPQLRSLDLWWVSPLSIDTEELPFIRELWDHMSITLTSLCLFPVPSISFPNSHVAAASTMEATLTRLSNLKSLSLGYSKRQVEHMFCDEDRDLTIHVPYLPRLQYLTFYIAESSETRYQALVYAWKTQNPHITMKRWTFSSKISENVFLSL
jgi:hypothetical protein